MDAAVRDQRCRLRLRNRIAADGFGAYVIGTVTGTLPGQTSAGGQDVYVRQYDDDGNEVLTLQFGTGASEKAGGIGLDASAVYVAGFTGGTYLALS